MPGPGKVDLPQRDREKARDVPSWQAKADFGELVEMTVDADGELAREERALADHRAAAQGRG